MAGVGFELKKLFQKKGMVQQLKAYVYSTIVVVGPLLLTMLLVLGIQLMMIHFSYPYYLRERFISGVIYAFIFSYLIVSLISMVITRTVSDRIYQKKYEDILPIFYRTLQCILPVSALIGIIYLILAPLSIVLKFTVYLFYMELILIWTLSIFLSAVKDYRKIVLVFVFGIGVGLIGTYLLFAWIISPSVENLMMVLISAFLLAIALLWWNVETTFFVQNSPEHITVRELFRYPSLMCISFVGAFGLFSHQFIEWLGPSGVWIDGTYRMAPRYDVAVYYAFLSILPSLVISVVSLETNFYTQYKRYYEWNIQHGTVDDIVQTQRDMAKVLGHEISKLMGIQLLFSILSIIVGIRLLPYIGFTMTQIEVFVILVMGFYAYSIYSNIIVILLYFDDRKGTMWLTILFTALTVLFSVLFLFLELQGVSFFLATSVSVIIAFLRLSHMIKNLHYYTFSAQPLRITKP